MTHSFRVNDGRWRAQARCGNENPEKFFPTHRPSSEARRDCIGCPVRSECLEAALSSPWEPAGIWGGLMPGEIQHMWAARHESPSRRDERRQLFDLA